MRDATIVSLLEDRRSEGDVQDGQAWETEHALLEEVIEQNDRAALLNKNALDHLMRVGVDTSTAVFQDNKTRATESAEILNNEQTSPMGENTIRATEVAATLKNDQSPSMEERLDREREDLVSSAAGEVERLAASQPLVDDRSLTPAIPALVPVWESSEIEQQLKALRKRRKETPYTPPISQANLLRKWKLFTRAQIERKARLREKGAKWLSRRRAWSEHRIPRKPFLTRVMKALAPYKKVTIRALDKWMWPVLNDEEKKDVSRLRRRQQLSKKAAMKVPGPRQPIQTYRGYTASDKLIDETLPRRFDLPGYRPRPNWSVPGASDVAPSEKLAQYRKMLKQRAIEQAKQIDQDQPSFGLFAHDPATDQAGVATPAERRRKSYQRAKRLSATMPEMLQATLHEMEQETEHPEQNVESQAEVDAESQAEQDTFRTIWDWKEGGDPFRK
jgi:hypothetical protein